MPQLNITYGFVRGFYHIRVDGKCEEAFADLVDFLKAIDDFEERYTRREIHSVPLGECDINYIQLRQELMEFLIRGR